MGPLEMANGNETAKETPPEKPQKNKPKCGGGDKQGLQTGGGGKKETPWAKVRDQGLKNEKKQ